MDFSIVLLRPEIPHNTGAIGRLCVGLGVKLNLVRPLGFQLDDKSVARAGLDYWPHLDKTIHDTWEDYLAAEKPKRVFFLSTHGEKSLYDCKFEPGDALVFGNEGSGLPKDFYEKYKDQLFRIPMPGEHARSINLANAVSIAAYECQRQLTSKVPPGTVGLQSSSCRLDDKKLKEMFHTLTPEEWRKVSAEEELKWWTATNRFCGCCGAPMKRHPNPAEHAYICESCGYRSYPKIMPAVITVIVRKRPDGVEEILLQRNTHYGLPYWTLVAGFVDPGETLEEAVIREAQEESGVRVKNPRFFRSQIWPFPSNIMVAFYSEWESGELKPDGEEVVESGWFDRDHLPPLPRPGSVARGMIDAWVNGTDDCRREVKA